MRYSHQRELITEILKGRKDHPTADVIYQNIRKEHPNISLGTVYRNLSILAERGDILKLTYDDKFDHFDACTEPHSHFYCKNCHGVSDIEVDLPSTLLKKAKKLPRRFWKPMNNTTNPKLSPNARKLRREMTKEERHLWYDFLKTYPIKFTRQKVLGKYIADFYCAKAKLIIELDGSGHYTEEGKQYDEERTAFLEEYGLTVIRIPNTEVHKNFRGVCEYIDHLVEQSLSQLR